MNSSLTGGPEVIRCLLVQAGEHVCAIPLRQVRRVVRAVRVTPLPGAAPELLGLAEYAGEPLPVFALASLIGAPPGANPDFPVTIVGLAGPSGATEVIGLNADGALRFADVVPERAVPAGAGIVRSEAVVDGAAVRVLDLALLGASA